MRSTTVARLLYNPIFQENALQGWHVPRFPCEVSPSPAAVSPCPWHSAGCSRHGLCQDPPGEPRYTPHQQETQGRGVEGVKQLPTESTRSYKPFLHSDTKPAHKAQVARGQQSSSTLPGPRHWQTLDPGPQKGCETPGLCPRTQPHMDSVCSPTPTHSKEMKEMSSSLQAV